MQARARWLSFLLVLGLSASACDRQVFDHGQAQLNADAGVAAVDCELAAPGTRCDDGNVCTTSSTCRDQQCLAGSSSRECTIADSYEPVADEQGKDGWSYGLWNASLDADAFYDSATDFNPMEYCDDLNWRPPGVCGLQAGDPEFRWTTNLSWSLQHPETNPDIELPIRRWVSRVRGPARVVVEHRVDGDFSDGTRALLLIDGDEVWSHEAIPGAAGEEHVLEIELREGTMIEQLVHPIGHSADDTTFFSLQIQGR